MRSGPEGPLFFYRCGLNIPDNAKLLSGTGLDALATMPDTPRMAISDDRDRPQLADGQRASQCARSLR